MPRRILTLLFIVISAHAWADKLLTPDEGLTSSMVNYMYQDSQGMIWVATEDGLNRYDGYKVTSYLHDEGDSTSLAHNFVTSLFEDSHANMLVGTYTGMQLYRRATDDFSPIAVFPTGQTMTESPKRFVEYDGRIVSSGDLLLQVEVRPDGTLLVDTLSWQIPYHNIQEVIPNPDGSLWVRKANALYRVKEGVSTLAEGLTPEAFVIHAIFADGAGGLYLASAQGRLYHTDGRRPASLTYDGRISEGGTIHSLAWLDANHLLLGTDGHGIVELSLTDGNASPYVVNIPSLVSSKLKVHNLLRDHDGNLWLGLYQRGIAMLSMGKKPFHYIGHKEPAFDLIGPTSALCLCEDREQRLWVGTDGDGLYCLNADRTQSRHYSPQRDGVPATVNTLFLDSEGTLWLGSYNDGCYRKPLGSNAFVNCNALLGKDSNPQSPHRVMNIIEDRTKRIWLATLGEGLYCYNLRTQALEPALCFHTGINLWDNCLLHTTGNKLIVGTYDGVYWIDLSDPMPKPQHLFKRSIVFTLYEDSHRTLWAGGAEGLIHFSIEHGRQRVYTSNQGLRGSTVYAIDEDGNGGLWVTTNGGLNHLSLQTGGVISYSASDGLQGNEFAKNASMTDWGGNLWLAGSNGLTWFNPSEVQGSQRKRHVRIVDLYLDNRPITARTLTEGVPITDSAVCQSQHFSLAYSSNTFSIELATVELDTPEHAEYRYRLNDGAWITLPHGTRHVSFTDLKPGRYRFACMVVENTEASDMLEATIEIRPPWWQSAWAKLLYALLVALAVYIVIHQTRQHYRSRQQILEESHAHEMAQEKIKILSRISHEIRTPMSLIISPLQQLIEVDRDPQRQNIYQTMMRNADRLQHLAAQATDEEPIGPVTPVEPVTPTDVAAAPFVAPSATPREAPLPTPRTKWQMLIVEDDPEVRQYLCTELSHDFHIRECQNGREALEKIFERRPDIVISDVTMPVMDGITLCRKIKQNIQLAQMPVILLTARADEESTLQGLGIGADAYITKPFYIKIVRQKAINLINLRTQLRNAFQGQQMPDEKLEKLEMQNPDEKLMERIMRTVNKHLSDPDLSVEIICSEVGISRVHLYRKLKEITNQSPTTFVRNIRLRQAETLLLDGKLPVVEIAERVGFRRSSYFISSFRELYGMSPNQWRDARNNNAGASNSASASSSSSSQASIPDS